VQGTFLSAADHRRAGPILEAPHVLQRGIIDAEFGSSLRNPGPLRIGRNALSLPPMNTSKPIPRPVSSPQPSSGPIGLKAVNLEAMRQRLARFQHKERPMPNLADLSADNKKSPGLTFAEAAVLAGDLARKETRDYFEAQELQAPPPAPAP
jgi:hypothetical protein